MKIIGLSVLMLLGSLFALIHTGKGAVIDCIIYQCQEETLRSRIESSWGTIDYYLVVEGQARSQAGFCFNRLNFKQYNNRIVFLPFRNIKDKFSSYSDSKSIEWIDRSVNNVLNLLAFDEDVILLGDMSEIVKKASVQKFIQQKNQYSCLGKMSKSRLLTRSYMKAQHISIMSSARRQQCTQTIQGSIERAYSNPAEPKVIKATPIPKTRYYDSKATDHSFEPVSGLINIIIGVFLCFISWLIPEQTSPHRYQAFKFELLNKISENLQQFDIFLRKRHIIISRCTVVGIIGLCFLIHGGQLFDSEWKMTSYNMSRDRRLSFDCMAYNGEDHILQLKLRVHSSFIDFHVITEGQWSHTGVHKELRFNYSKFLNYANKILYIPLRNMPNMVADPDLNQKYRNQNLMRQSALVVVEPMGRGRDVLIIADLDEIVSVEGFQQFDPYRYDWAGLQLRMFYFYFNRMSVFDTPERKKLTNYCSLCARITTLQVVHRQFGGNLNGVRGLATCPKLGEIGFASQSGDFLANCNSHFIPMAGWHYTYVLDNEHLLMKMRQNADTFIDYTINDYENFRKRGVAKNAYTIDIGLFQDRILAKQLVMDVLAHGRQSIFAKYLTGLDLQNYRPVNVSALHAKGVLNSQSANTVNPRATLQQVGLGVCWNIYGQCTILSAVLVAVIVIGLLLKMGVVLGIIACRFGKAIVLKEEEGIYRQTERAQTYSRQLMESGELMEQSRTIYEEIVQK